MYITTPLGLIVYLVIAIIIIGFIIFSAWHLIGKPAKIKEGERKASGLFIDDSTSSFGFVDRKREKEGFSADYKK